MCTIFGEIHFDPPNCRSNLLFLVRLLLVVDHHSFASSKVGQAVVPRALPAPPPALDPVQVDEVVVFRLLGGVGALLPDPQLYRRIKGHLRAPNLLVRKWKLGF